MTIQEIFNNVFHALMPFDFQFFLFLVSGLTCYAKPFFFQLLMANVISFLPCLPSPRRYFRMDNIVA